MILPQGYYKTFFWKNLLLMKITPILDQAVFSFPPNVGERFSILSKILKTPFPICFQSKKRMVIFTILSS
jgi:glucose-6-phosphate isomerase